MDALFGQKFKSNNESLTKELTNGQSCSGLDSAEPFLSLVEFTKSQRGVQSPKEKRERAISRHSSARAVLNQSLSTQTKKVVSCTAK